MNQLNNCFNEFYISIPILSTLILSIGFNLYFCCRKNKTQTNIKNNIKDKYLELAPIKGELPRWVIEDYNKKIEKNNNKKNKN